MFSKSKRRLPKLERLKGLCGKPLNIQHGNGAAIVVRAGESSAHGEGRQEGNMTEGSDGKTIDGMSAKRIDHLIASLKDHRCYPNPARRTYIQKNNNPQKKRPLGIPSFDDKLLQEVVRMILESIYEDSFSRHSHGFRSNHSCHTALMEVKHKFIGSKWFIEGDIKGCFDNVDHAVLINLLRRRIKDEYFISLIWKFLKAGYMEDWVYHNTYSGTPQGSIISPILANIYLHELDCFMERLSDSGI